jgi:hypothetical protein
MNFDKLIHIDEFSSTPKYRQLANSIIEGIQQKLIKKGDILPSINEVSFQFYISRITVEKGYNYLKSIGIIDSVRGKGFFINVDTIPTTYRIFLLFNKLSEHKKIIYDAFVATMGDEAMIDFYVYNNDFNLFKRIFERRDKDYTHIVIIHHFLDDDAKAYQLIKSLPKEKLILVDKMLPELIGQIGTVYENFENDIYQSLTKVNESLAKYSRLNLIFPSHSYYPKEIIRGFEHFCQDFAFEYQILADSNKLNIQKGDLFISVMEDDLIHILDQILVNKLKLGKDIGLISYNETPIKRLIGQGIATMSTDFKQLGISAAELVKSGAKDLIENPFYLTQRPSL